MAATVLIARQGEALDGLLHRSAGLGPHALPGVLAANPGLSGTVALAAGQGVVLPEALSRPSAATPQRKRLHLWS
ncbi:phage tail protein [Candidatus Saccharibacteria bacterium]|nr:phage tail protein [Candidatus Saccharibacteria bacterium]|tara:strand:+ start:983 stop:1207 length:225 start_codon:yes stop_codon:yes gene_type:complete